MSITLKIKTKKHCITWNINKFINNMFCLLGFIILQCLIAQMIYTYLFTFNY